MIDGLEKLLAQHRADLLHLDGVLRLYQPERDPTEIRPKQTRGRNRYFGQGELSRLCREAFRDADGPLSVADLTAAVITAKGFNAGDRVLFDRIDDLIKSALGPMRRVGSVDKIGEGRGVRWRLAEWLRG
jgi:hypothetical protein